MKLLLIEDEPLLLEEMARFLTEQGYLCDKAARYDDAEDRILFTEYDAIILDITLPGGSGLHLLETLRKNKKEAGVVIISAKDSLSDKLSGLKMGADDYITKPFHLEELNARISALLRRKYSAGQNAIIIDDLIIDTTAQTVVCNGNAINLTKKEYELLIYLIINKNRVVSKQAIARHLWGEHYDTADNYDTVYVHTMNLRKKINGFTGVDYIKTIYGMGYKFQRA